MNPLAMSGRTFLSVYLLAGLISVVVTFLLRDSLAGPRSSSAAKTPPLNPYEIAYLSGGPRRIVDAVLCMLAHDGYLDTKGDTLTLRQRLPANAPVGAVSTYRAVSVGFRPAHPIEQAVWEALARGSLRYGELVARLGHIGDWVVPKLVNQGLALSSGRRNAIRFGAVGPLAALFGLGVAKIFVGLDRGRPVGFLVILSFIVVGIIVWLLFRRSAVRYSTHYGEDVLAKMKTDNAALELTMKTAPDQVAPRESAMALGLFGPAAMGAGIIALAPFLYDAEGTFATTRRVAGLGVNRRSSSYWTSSCGSSSCGSSSCGGSCGGGCGGGCGGCGS